MKRKILTYTNLLGENEDLIPYVDGYGVEIGGTNLVDYLNQIESTFSKALLFLGAFASEEALLEAYPNGSDLEDGTYAIVADTDTLYIYDTTNEEWLATASNISGIMELNGLTPVSGALTITGGDINSTVSSADTQTQTITAHLNALYEENDNQNTELGKLLTESVGKMYATTSAIGNGMITYTATVSARDYEKECYMLFITANSDAVGTEYVRFTVTDGTRSKTYPLYYSSGSTESAVRYKQLYAKLGFNDANSPYGLCMMYKYEYTSTTYIIDWNSKPMQRVKTYNLVSNSWSSSQSGGYYQRIIFRSSLSEPIKIKPKYTVLSVSKQVDGKTTTAIVDYSISDEYDSITIYSDEQFNGSITILFNYE